MAELIARFGSGTPHRQAATASLLRVFHLVHATGKLERCIIFGSYVTATADPYDVDIFLVMAEDFHVDDYMGETREVFSHAQAQRNFGASVFWVSRSTSIAHIDDLVAAWQTKRDQTRRSIVEVIL